MILTCNRFERGNTFSGTKYGLWVDDNVPMENIGGDPADLQGKSPNANVFPTASSRPTTRYDQNSPGAWVAPNDFVAVRFGTTTTEYYSYDNEFLGTVLPTPFNLVVVSSMECYTDANGHTNPTPNQIEVCPSLGSSVVYFPLRIAPFTSLGSVEVGEGRLYPNPVNQHLVVELGSDQLAYVPVVSDLTGKVLDVSWSRTDKGYQADMTSLPSGLYYVKVGHHTSKIIKQ